MTEHGTDATPAPSTNALGRRQFLRTTGMLAAGASAAPLLTACGGGGGGGNGPLKIWWNKGYYPAEDDAARKVVKAWEKKTGNKADLQLYGTQDIVTKEQSAVTSGDVPDVIYAQKGFTPKYAFQGKLADVSEVIKSTDLTDGAKRAGHLYNSKEGKTSYYSVPIHQFTVSMFYWHSLVQQAGMDDSDLPKDWDAFWGFWKDAQAALKKNGTNAYAVGWPMGTAAGDTNYDTQQILRAYNVPLLDKDSQLQADDPAVRKGMTKALGWIADLYSGQFTPKSCVNWQDSSNNTNFLNKTLISTPNGSLSIPGALKGKQPKVWKDIGTAKWPNTPSGSAMPSISLTHNAIVFEDSENKSKAKDFLKYLMRPENIGEILKGGKGRWFPVNQSLLDKPYWSQSDDPNVAAVAQQLGSKAVANWADLSPAYREVESTHVWGQALGKMTLQHQSPEQATDFALDQMKTIFEKFQR